MQFISIEQVLDSCFRLQFQQHSLPKTFYLNHLKPTLPVQCFLWEEPNQVTCFRTELCHTRLVTVGNDVSKRAFDRTWGRILQMRVVLVSHYRSYMFHAFPGTDPPLLFHVSPWTPLLLSNNYSSGSQWSLFVYSSKIMLSCVPYWWANSSKRKQKTFGLNFFATGSLFAYFKVVWYIGLPLGCKNMHIAKMIDSQNSGNLNKIVWSAIKQTWLKNL